MAKHLKYHKNYTEFGEPYQPVLPLNLEGLMPDDNSVRLLSHELEDLDYSLLYQAYSAKGRNPAVDPKTMYKILTYAYSQNIYSSRKIESAFLEWQTIYDWYTANFQGRNNYCKTDPDATFMHMKDGHMRNAQLKPGYNVQIAVDSEDIVATDIFRIGMMCGHWFPF